MIGLIQAGALAGALILAWPVYLHLCRKRDRRTLDIPSTRIFQFQKQKEKRKKRIFEHLPLLIFRALILASLILLMAQPFIQTDRNLPLPAIDTQSIHPTLGVVIDDSISAMHAQEGTSRLARCVKWLKTQIKQMEPASRLVFSFTTARDPTRPLSREEAYAMLDELTAIPEPGNAARALQLLLDSQKEEAMEILIMAPLTAGLWDGFKSDLKHPTTVNIIDVSDWRADCIIRSATLSHLDSSNQTWTCKIEGPPELMTGKAIRVIDRTSKPRKFTIGPGEAIRGEVDITLPTKETGPVHELIVDASGEHPWFHYYICEQQMFQPEDQTVIIREDSEYARRAAGFLTMAISALRPSARITDSTTGAHQPPPLPDASTVIIIGNGRMTENQESWLDRQLTRETRVLCVPAIHSAEAKPAQDRPSYLPRWSAPEQPENGIGSVTVDNNLARLLKSSVTRMEKCLNEMEFHNLSKPEFDGKSAISAATADSQPLLTCHVIEENKSVIWALGFPLLLYEKSPLVHPGWLGILNSLLFKKEKSEKIPQENAFGKSMNLNSWFMLDSIDGTIITPDCNCQPAQGTADSPVFLSITNAGIYQLALNEDHLFKTVNFPREPETSYVTTNEFTARRPNTKVIWQNLSSDIRSLNFKTDARPDVPDKARKYDLSAAVIALLAIFLGLESIASITVWRNRMGKQSAS